MKQWKKPKKLLPEDDYHETQTILPYHHDKSLAAAGGTVAGSAWSRPREGPRTARRLELLACGLRGVKQPVGGLLVKWASSCISVWKEFPKFLTISRPWKVRWLKVVMGNRAQCKCVPQLGHHMRVVWKVSFCDSLDRLWVEVSEMLGHFTVICKPFFWLTPKLCLSYSCWIPTFQFTCLGWCTSMNLAVFGW